MTKHYTINQAAAALGVGRQRIQDMIKEGYFPGVYRCPCGHGYLIPANEVEREIKRRGRL